MNALEQTLERLRSRGEGVFMPFLVLGDPDPDTSVAAAEALARGGADIIELGLPFSDPPADGPVIQAADQRALAAGMTTEAAFGLMSEIHARTARPLALLVYYNLILSQGVQTFYARAKDAGVDAILVADLPIEEADEALAAAEACDVAPIFIVSELTTPERLETLLTRARAYLYLVARIGITGEQQAVSSELGSVIEGLKGHTNLPLLAGFGLAEPAHVRAVLAAGADGAICGSAVVRRIAEHLQDRQCMLEALERFCHQMKAATLPSG